MRWRVCFLGFLSCLAPTEIVLDLSTNVPCSQVTAVHIDVGQAGAAGSVEDLETQQCSDGGIGTLAVTRGGASDPIVTVEVTEAVGTTLDLCDAGSGSVGCIVARRALRYTPHEPLHLPIALDSDCLNVSCMPNATCEHGQCVPSMIDPGSCVGDAGCQLAAVAVQLAMGATHACARMSDGTVECWGDNTHGQLGTTSVGNSSPVPVRVETIDDATRISAANETTCVIRATGEVWCWGDDSSGAVDAMPSGIVATPKGPVVPGATAISVGSTFACAVAPFATNFNLVCWGTIPSMADGGTFGPGPAPFGGAQKGATELACGFSACAETDGTAITLFGEDVSDQLLFNNSGLVTLTTPSFTTLPLSPVGGVAMGAEFGCAFGGPSNIVGCWGFDDSGQLGQAVSSSQPMLPVRVGTLSNVTALSAAGSHVLAISGGVPYGWGDNTMGVLGLGNSSSPQYGPMLIPMFTGAVEIVTGQNGTCARQAAFGITTVTCWGDSYLLGDGTTTTTPRLAPGAPVKL